MKEKICPRCKKEKQDINFMWGCIIDEKMVFCVMVCKECDDELDIKHYEQDNE